MSEVTRVKIQSDFMDERRWPYARDMFGWIIAHRADVALMHDGKRCGFNEETCETMNIRDLPLDCFRASYSQLELEGPDDLIVEFVMRFEGACPK